MKFCVEDDLRVFEFHDATLTFVSFDGEDLTVSAGGLNIHKSIPQNPSDFDMEIASAQITFRNFRAAAYEPGIAWTTGTDGKSYPVEPRVVFFGQEAMGRILAELKNGLTVHHFEKEDRGYSVGGCGIEPYFEMEFDFDSVVVCWDEYKKKAWYELHRRYRYEVVLETPCGNETVELTVHWHEEKAYRNGDLGQGPFVAVGCQYGGKEYWGHGKDDLWIDAFADLQRKLPQGVQLKCCLTCRHGNLCPVGNERNEVFCTRDVAITQKSDLYFCTEDPAQREKRARQYCGVCKDYAPQSKGFYTYNDYLHFLRK